MQTAVITDTAETTIQAIVAMRTGVVVAMAGRRITGGVGLMGAIISVITENTHPHSTPSIMMLLPFRGFLFSKSALRVVVTMIALQALM